MQRRTSAGGLTVAHLHRRSLHRALTSWRKILSSSWIRKVSMRDLRWIPVPRYRWSSRGLRRTSRSLDWLAAGSSDIMQQARDHYVDVRAAGLAQAGTDWVERGQPGVAANDDGHTGIGRVDDSRCSRLGFLLGLARWSLARLAIGTIQRLIRPEVSCMFRQPGATFPNRAHISHAHRQLFIGDVRLKLPSMPQVHDRRSTSVDDASSRGATLCHLSRLTYRWGERK